MKYQKIAIYQLLVASLIFTYLSNSYAMALIFVSASGLLGFFQYSEGRKTDEVSDLWKEVKHLSSRLEQINLSRKMSGR